MEYQKLGKSSLYVSRLGLGCMGMSEFYGSSNDDMSVEIIKTAISKGINFFDTADVYGFGHNEKLIGGVIANHPKRDDLVIATKCGIVRDKNDSRKRSIDNSYDYIIKCCDNSIERLNTSIDLFYLHRVDDTSIFESMKAMSLLLSQRKIKAVGLSEVRMKTIEEANAILRDLTDNEHGISAVQTEYSIFSRNVEQNGVLNFCNENSISFVAYSPLSRGLLTSQLKDINQLEKQDSRNYLPRFVGNNFKNNKNIVETILVPIAYKYSCTVSQLCLAWLFSKSKNIFPIPGTRRLSYLLENIKAVNIMLSDKDIIFIDKSVANFVIHGERYPKEDMIIYGFDE